MERDDDDAAPPTAPLPSFPFAREAEVEVISIAACVGEFPFAEAPIAVRVHRAGLQTSVLLVAELKVRDA